MNNSQLNAQKVLLLVASNSENSINRELAQQAAKMLATESVVMDMLPFDNLPLYSARRQAVGFPEPVQQLVAQLSDYAGFVIVSPEHNGSMPAVFKNLIDWLSRLQVQFLSQKPVMLLSTSPGANGGRTNLEQLAKLVPWWGGQVTGTYSMGSFYDKMNREEQRLDAQTEAELRQLVERFQQAVFKASAASVSERVAA